MKIVIEFNDIYTDEFIKWLVDRVRTSLIKSVNEKYLVVMSEYLNSLDIPVEIDLCDAFIDIINNIYYFKSKSCYHIGINPIKRFKRTRFKLVDLAKFINYGNREVNGTFVFSNVFYDITSNLKYYHNLYMTEEGVV